MNRVYKTRWSVARQQYVVTDEEHASKGKASKSVVALAVAAAAALTAGIASAAYVPAPYADQNLGTSAFEDPGKIGDKASWETDEYKKDWGLTAMNASSAYALGYHGQGVALGVMDSGALLQAHPELAGDRFHASHASGVYGSTGNRYQVSVPGVGDVFGNGDFTEGEAFDIDGNWISHVNDTHGTHVTGTVGANRDGSEFHGVAWGSDIWVGNTGGTDNTNYGLPQDYNFFYAGWSALAQNLISVNGAERGGVINNSFGTNLRINKEKPVKSLSTNTTAQTEYEYFLFKQNYGDSPSFVDAAYDAVKDTNVVQVMTTGNRDMDMPYYRALYPYFNPEAEKHWIAVAGLEKEGTDAQGNDTYKWVDDFNQAGNAKWWTVVAPGDNIYSSIVYDDHYESTSEEHPLGSAGYASYGGTSMAAPHVTGAMGVLMSRYESMSAIQVRDILFTTARHTNKDGSTFTGWTVADGQVDPIYGWGLPDLEKGMYGPGQLLGNFDYNLKGLDVWTNDISQVALEQRKAEDVAWMELTENGTNLDAEDYVLGTGSIPDVANAIIDKDDAKKWRAEYYAKRAATIQYKLDNGLYDGSLVKRGEGTLVMLGSNTYKGGTTVEEGTLVGFTESFGDKDVVVNGGNFGVIKTYNDTFTDTGSKTSTEDRKANVVVNAGGTYLISAGEDVNVGNLNLKEGAGVSVWTGETSDLISAWTDGTELSGSVTADNLAGTTAVGKSHLAFFQSDVVTEGNTITATMQKREGGMAAAATTYNGRGIGAAVESAPESKVFEEFIGATKDQAARTFDSLGSDINFAAQNLAVVNSLTLTRAVKDQAMGYGTANTAKLDNGVELWATGIGAWSNADAGGASTDLDADFYAGLIGGELQVCSATKLGVFFGAGTTDFKGGNDGDIDSDDIHAGIYGETNVGSIAASYGFTYTWQDRELKRGLVFMDTVGMNTTSYDADIMQLFGEVAYTGLNTDTYSVEPYFGFSWIHAKADGFSETVGGHTMASGFDNQNIEVTHLGVRGAMPFKLASVDMKVKGDVNWMHFFGDTEAEGTMRIGDAGVAALKGEELDNLFGVGLGIEAKAGESTTFGLSYTGAYGSDVTSHGIGVNVRYAF